LWRSGRDVGCWRAYDRGHLNIHLAPELANFTAADLDSLVRIVKRKLKRIQHRPHCGMPLRSNCEGAE
jgi:hypothetical protein